MIFPTLFVAFVYIRSYTSMPRFFLLEQGDAMSHLTIFVGVFNDRKLSLPLSGMLESR